MGIQVQAKAFYTLRVTGSGESCSCLRPKRSNSSNPYSGTPSSNRSINEGYTHTTQAFNPLPATLVDNTEVEVDGEKYRVVRNGVEKGPAGARVYLSTEFADKVQVSPFPVNL